MSEQDFGEDFEQDSDSVEYREKLTSLDERVSKVVLEKAGPDELDVVTIVMLPNLTTAEQSTAGSASNKRRRLSSGDAATLGKVEVRASRLRKCSTYFQACMSERWAEAESSAKTFHLEAQAEAKHYEDCFARMSFLNRPIASVKDGIELLKVASQIGFQDAVDVGVKYLAAAPWSDDEENLVRDFCSSPYLAPCEWFCYLKRRLEDLPPGAMAKLEKNSLAVAKLLSRLLWVALPPVMKSGAVDSLREDVWKCPEAKKRFAIAFRRILREAKSGAVCDGVVECARRLVGREASRLVEEFTFAAVDPHPDPYTALLDLCWLFELAHRSDAAQGIAELLVSECHDQPLKEILTSLRYIYESWDHHKSQRKLPRRWAWMVYTVMEDVMAGKLFLDAEQRLDLFERWSWFVCEKFLRRDKTHIAALLMRFVTTMPQPLQEWCWASVRIDHEEGPESREAYALWVSHMASLDVNPPPPPDPSAGSPPIENEVKPAEEE